jgi:hypothetical protein
MEVFPRRKRQMDRGDLMLDTGYSLLVTGCWLWMLNSEFWLPYSDYCILNPEPRSLTQLNNSNSSSNQLVNLSTIQPINLLPHNAQITQNKFYWFVH